MTTFIDTNDTNVCQRVKLGRGLGEVAEIVNKELCGAQDVKAMLRWLDLGERFEANTPTDKCQMIYLMAGQAIISLNGEHYNVNKGKGVYLEPGESAVITQREGGVLKLLHLVVAGTEA